MVQRRFGPWSLALAGALVLFGSRPGLSAPVSLTGFVEKDFAYDPSNPSKVQIQQVTSSPTTIGQMSWITQNGWVSGWNVKDIRFSYDKTTDTMYVGVNTWANANGQYAPFGQANGDPNGVAQSYDPAHLGSTTPTSDKSFALAISTLDPANPNAVNMVAIAGIPADKSKNGPGQDGFVVASVDKSRASGGLGYMFGSALPNQIHSNLAFEPNPSQPQLEFSITNFSKLVDPTKGFKISAYAGSGLDGVAGEANLGWKTIGPFAEQNVPEPAALLAWATGAGIVALRVRSRSRAKS